MMSLGLYPLRAAVDSLSVDSLAELIALPAHAAFPRRVRLSVNPEAGTCSIATPNPAGDGKAAAT
jgi:hypothetical protein